MAARPFRTLLEQATGVSGTVVQGGSPRQLADRLARDQVQLGVFQGVEFAWAKTFNNRLHPLVLCVNQTRTVRAYLIVRASWKGASVADLEGRVLAVPQETREHCRAFLERCCVTARKAPRTFYKTITTAADAEEALDEVHDSNATAAGKPGCAGRLRVLLASDPFPSSVVAIQTGRFDAGQVSRFRDGLVSAGGTARGQRMMELLRMTAFEAIPADFDQLLNAVAKAYPPR
jgi:ABC-type phosphate/phosphonate transport system substrate-binding protein